VFFRVWGFRVSIEIRIRVRIRVRVRVRVRVKVRVREQREHVERGEGVVVAHVKGRGWWYIRRGKGWRHIYMFHTPPPQGFRVGGICG